MPFEYRIQRCRRRLKQSVALCGLLAVMSAVPQLSPVYAALPQQQSSVVETNEIDISAQTLKRAFLEFTAQTSVQVVYASRLNVDVPIKPLKGSFTADEALRQMLSGTGLTYRYENTKTIRIVSDTDALNGAGEDVNVSEKPVQEIMVTGSRVSRAGFDLITPANVVNSDFLEARAFTTAAPAIEQLPGFFLGQDVSRGTQITSNIGQSFPNAFGLGTNRTLVLVNGRRTVSQNGINQFSQQATLIRNQLTPIVARINSASPGDQVDLNTISTALIDRIEVIYTGGTPAYGSGAMAGTVNVLLKDDFEGLELSSQYGISGAWDAQNTKLQGIWGKNLKGGRGNFTVSVDYTKENGLYVDERVERIQGMSICSDFDESSFRLFLCDDITTVPGAPNTGLITRDGLPLADDYSNGLLGEDGKPLILDFDGGLIARSLTGLGLGRLDSGAGAGTNPYYTFDLVKLYNVVPELIVPQKRLIAQSIGHYQVTDDIRFFYEASYVGSKSKGDNLSPSFSAQLEDILIGPSGIFDRGSLPINAVDNPYITSELRDSLIFNGFLDPNSSADQTFYVRRSNVDILGGRGRGRNERNQDIYRGVIGLDGGIRFLARDIGWELALVYGETQATLHEVDIDTTRLMLAVDAVKSSTTGDILCRVVDSPVDVLPGFTEGLPRSPTMLDVEKCVPINVLGFNQISPGAREYLLQENISRSRQRQYVAEFNIETSLFDMPAGSLDFAGGYQFRRESGLFKPTQQTFINGGLGATIERVSGHITSNEVYGELVLPVISEGRGIGKQKFIENWTFEGAARHIKHSISGSDISFKIGTRLNLNLPIIDDMITFRGHYTEAIRTPSLTEATSPTFSSSYPFLNSDPCRFGGFGPEGSITRTSCQAEVDQLIASGDLPADFDLSTFNERPPKPEIFRGNPNLGNEESKAWAVGFVVVPDFLPGLSFSADWTNLRLTKGITRIAAATACYILPDSDKSVCDLVERNPNTFALESTVQTYFNSQRRDLELLTATLEYQLDLESVADILRGRATFRGNYFYLHRDDLVKEDSNPFDRITPVTKRLNASVSYSLETFAAFLEWQHTGSFGDPDSRAGSYFVGFGPAVNIFNGSLKYDLGDGLSARLTVNDIFDDRGDDPQTQVSMGVVNPVGRNFILGLSAKF